MFLSLWLVASAATALGIASDMQCLGVNRIGTSRNGWLLACDRSCIERTSFGHLKHRSRFSGASF